MTLREIIEKENEYKSFKTPFGIVTVASDRNMYVVLSKKYAKLAKDASNHFLKVYNQYKSWEDICNKVEDDFAKSILPAIEAIQEDFISVGVYDIDHTIIFQKISDMGSLNPFAETYDKILERIYSIIGDVEENRQYREARKINRGRLQISTIGGNIVDFGKNQIKAGAANAAAGWAHSLANNFANRQDEKKAERLLEELFEDKSLGNKLADAINACVMEFKYSIFSLIMDYGLDIYFDFPTQEDVKRGKRLFDNLEKGSIPEEDKMSVLEEIFKCLCFEGFFYVYLLYSYANYTEKIVEMIEYFGVDITPALDRRLKLEYSNCDKSSIKQLSQIEAKVSKLMGYCHINELNTYNEIESQKRKLAEEQMMKIFENNKKTTEQEVLELQKKIDRCMEKHNIKSSQVQDEVTQCLKEVREKELQELYENAPKETEEEVLALQEEIDKYCKERKINSPKIMDYVSKCLIEVREKHLKEIYENGAKETEEEVLALQQKINAYMKEKNIEESKVKNEVAERLKEVRERYLEKMYGEGDKETREEISQNQDVREEVQQPKQPEEVPQKQAKQEEVQQPLEESQALASGNPTQPKKSSHVPAIIGAFIIIIAILIGAIVLLIYYLQQEKNNIPKVEQTQTVQTPDLTPEPIDDSSDDSSVNEGYDGKEYDEEYNDDEYYDEEYDEESNDDEYYDDEYNDDEYYTEDDDYYDESDEYVCPYSDTEKLTKSDVKALTKEEIHIAKNEIYARHGRKFQDKALMKYFNQTSWYDGYIEPEDFDESVFNSVEKHNIRLLAKYDK